MNAITKIMPNINNCVITPQGSGWKVEPDEGFALFRVEQYQMWAEKAEADPVAYPPESINRFVLFFKRAYLGANADGSNYDTMPINENMRIV